MVSGVAPGGARAVARCDTLGSGVYSQEEGMLFRSFLSDAHAAALDAVAGWMREAGMTVRLDSAANLIGRYEGTTPHAPALLIGSHIDSVRDGGHYDGPLGVMLGIELVAALHDAGERRPFAIEVIAFGDEEGSRFPASMLCSRAVAGVLEAEPEAVDRDGVSVAEARAAFPLPRHAELVSASIPPRTPTLGDGWTLKRVQGDGEESAPTVSRHAELRSASILPQASAPVEEWTLKRVQGDDAVGAGFLAAARVPSEILAFLEVHIEQGPVLEAANLPLGIVTGIAAQLRYRVVVTGQAGHAGTLPMGLRRDALAAAAEMVLAVERTARAAGGDVVATVGRLTVAPGAVNVVPGHVEFSLDVRSGDVAARDLAAEDILDLIADIADRRGLDYRVERLQDLPASPCDPRLMDLLDASVAACGLPVRRLVSGAGHDAMVMAALCPMAMLFVRCEGGISHNPAEKVDPGDVALALQAMLGFVRRFGGS